MNAQAKKTKRRGEEQNNDCNAMQGLFYGCIGVGKRSGLSLLTGCDRVLACT